MSAVVYYHRDWDGLVSAWVMRKLFPSVQARFESVQYGEPPPGSEVENSDVYILDFCYPAAHLLEMAARRNYLHVLDHHPETRTVAEEVAGHSRVRVTFDGAVSGCMLAWSHWSRDPAPALVRYAEDRDLWKFALPHSRAINAAMRTRPETFESCDELAELLDLLPTDLDAMADHPLVIEGEAVLRLEKLMIDQSVKHAEAMEIGVMRGLAVNFPVKGMISEVAGELAKRADFGACFYYAGRGSWAVSLRSRGETDVRILAEAHGGGGHPNAAGFSLEGPTVAWTYDRVTGIGAFSRPDLFRKLEEHISSERGARW